ncbi:MAG TPA: UvrB/UvrC motif-containing protein [Candidatus Paceibacterota bacterium]|nr:UvrB/UvrC motif-containing protein [Candidatus Paceibacterota bacterium]
MKWANFLHVYQPPTQKPIWVRRIADECYRKLFAGLRNIPRARVTLNINSVLCELLEQNGAGDVIDSIRALVEAGQVELTGSAKYHAFLPLLPEAEIERQIRLNEEGLNRCFGTKWKKGGFFSPEMAYSKKVAAVAQRMGYRWIVIDEMAFPADRKPARDRIYEIQGLKGFYAFFRERNFSFKILSASQLSTMPAIMRFLEPRFGKKEFTVTGMDGETFGHHRPGLEKLLFDLLSDDKIEPIAVGDALELGFPVEAIEPRQSTWASVPRDFTIGEPFLRWNNPNNAIQRYQWELTDLAISLVNRDGGQKPRSLLDSSLHSDQYWWSSARPWWSLEMIERGAYDLKETIRACESASPDELAKADELYKDILYTGFEWQRTGVVDELSRSENEEVRERLEEKEKLFVTAEEFEDMIKNLREQMRSAAQAEEYHRASMIKDRIRELEEEMERNGSSRPKPGSDLMF